MNKVSQRSFNHFIVFGHHAPAPAGGGGSPGDILLIEQTAGDQLQIESATGDVLLIQA